MAEPMTPLSAAAERRRVLLRAELLPLVVRRRRLRRARTMVVVLVGAALLLRAGAGGGAVPTPTRVVADGARPVVASPFAVAIVRDDPAIVARHRLAVVERTVRLNDDDLTRVLTGSGRAEGLLRIDGHASWPGLVVDRWETENEAP